MKILAIDDMLEAAHETDMPGYDEHIQRIEAAANGLSKALAAHLGIGSGPATFEGKALGGTCATFFPLTPDQPCPEMIDEGDEGGDWEPPQPGQIPDWPS
jgi:hypothetical protein